MSHPIRKKWSYTSRYWRIGAIHYKLLFTHGLSFLQHLLTVHIEREEKQISLMVWPAMSSCPHRASEKDALSTLALLILTVDVSTGRRHRPGLMSVIRESFWSIYESWDVMMRLVKWTLQFIWQGLAEDRWHVRLATLNPQKNKFAFMRGFLRWSISLSVKASWPIELRIYLPVLQYLYLTPIRLSYRSTWPWTCKFAATAWVGSERYYKLNLALCHML